MGELIKKIDTIKIGNTDLDIEVNHSARGNEFRDIHLQNKKFRLEIPENEFIQMCACVLLAKRQFDVIKGEHNE